MEYIRECLFQQEYCHDEKRELFHQEHSSNIPHDILLTCVHTVYKKRDWLRILQQEKKHEEHNNLACQR